MAMLLSCKPVRVSKLDLHLWLWFGEETDWSLQCVDVGGESGMSGGERSRMRLDFCFEYMSVWF
jgi:hypothetical protein